MLDGYNPTVINLGHQERRCPKMKESERNWKKQNTVMISIRLQKSSDADILEYLDGKQKQTTIKAALREYMERHNEKGEDK